MLHVLQPLYLYTCFMISTVALPAWQVFWSSLSLSLSPSPSAVHRCFEASGLTVVFSWTSRVVDPYATSKLLSEEQKSQACMIPCNQNSEQG